MPFAKPPTFKVEHAVSGSDSLIGVNDQQSTALVPCSQRMTTTLCFCVAFFSGNGQFRVRRESSRRRIPNLPGLHDAWEHDLAH